MNAHARTAALPRHPIQVVARRTGLSADVIRAWEKRYEVVTPVRSETGRRLYSDADVEHLRLLAHATLSGRAIGQLAALPHDALAAIVRADGEPASSPALAPLSAGNGTGVVHATTSPGTSAPAHLAAALDAVERFDLVALDVSLRRAAVALSAEQFLDTLVVPFWDAVLGRVRDGSLRLAHEHVALSALRRALDRIVDATTSTLAPPELLVTTPLGQTQELGALLAAATAAADGWRATYVGPGLPAEAIAETLTQLGARAVALGLGAAAGDRVIPRELRRLRTLLPPDVAIMVEGAAADAHRGVLREIDAVVLRDPASLRRALRSTLRVRGDREQHGSSSVTR